VGEDGHVHDEIRRTFLHDFIASMKRAAYEGIPVLGYQHWSIMDNFEWCSGYGPRFGLIHVDYDTQKRTIKDSARYYARIIESNGEKL
jgi:beta-glucosidase